MRKTIKLYDDEDDTSIVLVMYSDCYGMDVYFEGPFTFMHTQEKDYGCVSKKKMYKFCKNVIKHLENEQEFIK